MVASAAARSRPWNRTWAPLAHSFTTTARPTPRVPPVTTMVRPPRSSSIQHPFSQAGFAVRSVHERSLFHRSTAAPAAVPLRATGSPAEMVAGFQV